MLPRAYPRGSLTPPVMPSPVKITELHVIISSSYTVRPPTPDTCISTFFFCAGLADQYLLTAIDKKLVTTR